MKKPKIKQAIKEASAALSELMDEKLTVIADDLVEQVMRNYRRLTDSQKVNAIKGIASKGLYDYKDSVKNALAVIALDALEQARKEVPKAKHVRLSEREDTIQFAEFERLPKSLQRKIQQRTDLLVGAQIGELQKEIEFAYATIEEETDSEEAVQNELNDSAIGWLDGTAVEAGATLTASTVINSARQAFFFDDEVLEEIEAFEFVNSDPVSPICEDLAGTIFAKDDPKADQYYPPLHWQCKSFIVPITKGNLGSRTIEKLRPSKASLEDQIQFAEKGCSHAHE